MNYTKVLVLNLLCVTSFLSHGMETKPTKEAIEVANKKLWAAVTSNDLAKVEQIIAEGVADVNNVDEYGNNTLICTSWYDNADIVNALIKAGADVNKANKNGYTAFINAVQLERFNASIQIINPSQKSFARKKIETLLAIHNKKLAIHDKEFSYLLLLPKEVLKIIITCMYPEEFTVDRELICSLHPQALVDNIPLENLALLIKDGTLNQDTVLAAWQKKINGITESLKIQKKLNDRNIQKFTTKALTKITMLLTQ